MEIPSSSLDVNAAYKLLSSVVVPRPIAWVTTRSEAGVVNLAPFSCFTYVCSRPPMVAMNIERRAGMLKDTARNIRDRKEYVIHIASWPLLEKLHRSGVEHPPEVSEVEVLGLATVPSTRVDPPRLAAAPVALECRWHQTIELGEFANALIIGEVLTFHFHEGLCVDGKVRAEDLNPIARLGGPNYAPLGPVVAMPPLKATPKGGKPREPWDPKKG